MENWDPIKDQWVPCFKDTALNLGETTNNRLESINSKIKSVCSKYGSLLQFFTEFFAVLGALKNERQHHRLMACARCPNCLLSMDDDLRDYWNFVTPYAFRHIQDQAKFSEMVKVKEELSDDTFLIAKNDQTDVVTVSPVSCQCNYPGRIGLPCRHILKVRQLLSLSRFDETLVLYRWKNIYVNNSFTPEPCDTILVESNNTRSDDCINVQDELPQKNIVRSTKKALKTAQSLASVASEGGMKTFNERMMQMQALLESWQTGKPFHLIDTSMHSIPKTVSETIDKLFSKDHASAFVGKQNSKTIPETSLQSGDINKADQKKESDVKNRWEMMCPG